jgi:hypothetical protein
MGEEFVFCFGQRARIEPERRGIVPIRVVPRFEVIESVASVAITPDVRKPDEAPQQELLPRDERGGHKVVVLNKYSLPESRRFMPEICYTNVAKVVNDGG